MNARERFLTAARCQPTDRPPIWIMRQAGRYLPEYRALKAQHSFHQLVMTPELACEVTMQPLRRYDLDAAILFSDILVIPEALGQPYHFRDSGGIEMEFALRGEEDLAKLDPSGVRDKLKYVADAIRLIRKNELVSDHRALLGFGGSPWTLATYMIEGQSSKEYATSREWFYTKRDLFDALLEKITEALIEYFHMQIEAGVDAIQIFDSWGGVLAPAAFKTASVDWMKRIIDALPKDFPVIVFSKGMHDHAPLLATTGAHLLGVDWTADLPRVRDSLPANVGVQGNLDPVLLNTTPDVVEREARNLLESMRGRTGFVFNLGHGILPSAKPDNVARLVDTVTSWS